LSDFHLQHLSGTEIAFCLPTFHQETTRSLIHGVDCD